MRGEPGKALAQDFLFLGGRGGVEFGDRRVGQLLDLGFVALALILADFLLIFVGFQIVHAVAADVADGDARLFGILAGELRQILASSEEHTSALQSLMRISYDVISVQKKKD